VHAPAVCWDRRCHAMGAQRPGGAPGRGLWGEGSGRGSEQVRRRAPVTPPRSDLKQRPRARLRRGGRVRSTQGDSVRPAGCTGASVGTAQEPRRGRTGTGTPPARPRARARRRARARAAHVRAVRAGAPAARGHARPPGQLPGRRAAARRAAARSRAGRRGAPRRRRSSERRKRRQRQRRGRQRREHRRRRRERDGAGARPSAL